MGCAEKLLSLYRYKLIFLCECFGAGLFFGSIDSKCKERLPVVNPPLDIVGTKVSVGISVGWIVGDVITVGISDGDGIGVAEGRVIGVGEGEGMEEGEGIEEGEEEGRGVKEGIGPPKLIKTSPAGIPLIS